MKLNLGSGNSKTMKDLGYTNIDIYKTEYVDLVLNIEKKLPYEDNSVEAIYCSHALEHCSMAAVPSMLKDWKRVLKTDGTIKIVVPEIESCMRNFLEASEKDKWEYRIEYILGGQHKQVGEQFHKSAYTPSWLRSLIERVGLVVDKVDIINNGLNDCIHLKAHKI